MKPGKAYWGYNPYKGAKPKVPDYVKSNLEMQAAKLINTVLKPMHIKPPPENPQFNYIVDIYTRWHSRYFYFCATYHCPGENAIPPSFESKFARIEYIGKDSFNLSYMRHTGQWEVVFDELSAAECLEAIKDQPFFCP